MVKIEALMSHCFGSAGQCFSPGPSPSSACHGQEFVRHVASGKATIKDLHH